MSKLTRRALLRRGSVVLGASILAACAPKVIKETVVVKEEVEKVVKETVVVKEAVEVEKEVTRVVEKVVEKEAPKKVEQPFELRIHTRVGGDLDQYFETVLDQFKEIVPNATVKIEAVPGGALAYASKVLVLYAGGQVGDALWSASRVGFNRRFMAVGIFAPLDPHMEAEHFDIEQYYDYCIDEATYDGKVMALPHISEPGNIGLMMNLDLFEQAGVEPLTFDSTTEDLINAGQAIAKDKNGDGKPDVWAFGNSNNYFRWVTHVRSYGGDFLNSEGTKCVLDDEKALAAFQNQYDLVYKYKITPSPADTEQSVTKMFQGGSLAMYVGWPIHASQWPDRIKDFKVSSTIMVNGPAGHGSMLNQHMMSVAAVAKHPEAAWEWVKWTCSRKFSIERALKGLGGPTGMASVWHDPGLLQEFPPWQEWAAIMDHVGPNNTAANLRGKELEDTLNQGISGIMVEEVGVKEGLERIREECQKVLDKPIAK